MKILIIIFLVIPFSFFVVSSTQAQDIIVLNSGEEVAVKIHSTKGDKIKLEYWDNREKGVLELNKKYVKRYILEYMKNERISVSFSFGGLLYGTSTYLKNYMKDNGYERSVPGFWGTIDYPTSNGTGSILFELEYLFKPPHGFSIEYARANNGNVKGYGTPEINFSNHQFAACYKLYLKNFRSNLQTGLIMDFGSIKDSDSWSISETDVEQSYFNWGFLVGIAMPLLEREEFFLRFQTQFRYIFPVEISNEEMFLSGEKVALSHLFIGIQTGFKIWTNK